MGDFAPLGYAVGLILFIGLAVPFVLGFFVDLGTVEASPFVSPVIDLVENGVSLGELTMWGITIVPSVSLNPFLLFGETLNAYLVESLTYLGMLPDFFIVMIAIMSLLGIFYTLIKLLPTT